MRIVTWIAISCSFLKHFLRHLDLYLPSVLNDSWMNYDSLFQISYLLEIIQVSKNKVTSCEFALAVLFGVRKLQSTARIISIFLQVLISRLISHVQQVDSLSFHPISYGWYALYAAFTGAVSINEEGSPRAERARQRNPIFHTRFLPQNSPVCLDIASQPLLVPFLQCPPYPFPLVVEKIRRSMEREIRDRFERFPPCYFFRREGKATP